MFANRTLRLLMLLLAVSAAYPVQADGPAPLFQDDFSTFDPGWGESDAVIQVVDGKLVITPVANTGRRIINMANAFEDMTASVNLVSKDSPQTAPGLAGMIFWANGYDDFYVAWCGPDGRVGVMRYLRGRWLYPVIARQSSAMKQGDGQLNQLTVKTHGNSATIIVNGQEVVSFKGQPPQGGGFVGFYAESPGSYLIDDLEVSAL